MVDAPESQSAGTVRRRRLASAGLDLRRAIDRAVHASPAVLTAAAELSAAYRAERPPRLEGARAAEAYAAARMPATFAAAAVAMTAGAEALPGFTPRSLLDVGAGTGAATWAARAAWPSLRSLTLLEQESAAIALGRRLGGDAWQWRAGDASVANLPPADLVVAAYVLGEIPARDGLPDEAAAVARLWAATLGALILVEPGSRAGYRRIIAARSALIEAGARIAAPCPSDLPCPIAASPDRWCHFLARLDRGRLQRQAKGGRRSFEDEPYAYLVAARPALVADPRPRVVLGRPRRRPGVVELRICDDGRIETVVVSRRDGPAYRRAADLTWGDAVRVPFAREG